MELQWMRNSGGRMTPLPSQKHYIKVLRYHFKRPNNLQCSINIYYKAEDYIQDNPDRHHLKDQIEANIDQNGFQELHG
jgi:hypothetical protein